MASGTPEPKSSRPKWICRIRMRDGSSNTVSVPPHATLQQVIRLCAEKSSRRRGDSVTSVSAEDLVSGRHGVALTCLRQFRVTDLTLQLRHLPLLPTPKEVGVVDISTTEFIEEPSAAIALSEASVHGTINLKRPGKKYFKKYFVALHSCNLLVFKSSKDSKPSKPNVFIGFFCVRDVESVASTKGETMFQFNLFHPSNGTFVFRLDTQEELDAWTLALRTATQNYLKMLLAIFMRHLDEHALDQEGLFRVSGSVLVVQDATKSIETGQLFEVDTVGSIHDIAGVFKACLRSMAEPLIPFSMYPRLIDIGRHLKDDSNPELFSSVIAELSVETRSVLAYLFSFFSRIVERGAMNRMSYVSLATVFAPNVLRPVNEDDMFALLHDAKICEAVLRSLAVNHRAIFPDEISAIEKLMEAIQYVPDGSDDGDGLGEDIPLRSGSVATRAGRSRQMTCIQADRAAMQLRLESVRQGLGNSHAHCTEEDCALDDGTEGGKKKGTGCHSDHKQMLQELATARAVRMALEARVSELTLRVAELEFENVALQGEVQKSRREVSLETDREANKIIVSALQAGLEAEKCVLAGERSRLESRTLILAKEKEALAAEWARLEEERSKVASVASSGGGSGKEGAAVSDAILSVKKIREEFERRHLEAS